jgi:hypothetical protein
MATFTEIHGLSLAENSYVENFHVEVLATDPTATQNGRIWYNSTEKTYKATSLDAGGAIATIVLGSKAELDDYIANLASTTAGEGSALVGYSGQTGANGEFSVVAGTLETSLDSIVTGIDANAQALVDLGNGSLTDLQNEIDAVETGAGLNANGTYTAPSSNYIGSSSSLSNADVLLDTQIKSNADALTAEVADRQSQDALKVSKSGDAMTGDLSLSTNRITNLGAPVDQTDAANKVYVDSAIAGISWKQPVKAASTANIDLTTGGLLTIDGVVLAAGDRVLVKDQTSKVENGIYDVVDGAWTRSADFDDSPDTEVEKGAAVFVEDGTSNADNAFTLLGNDTDGTAGIQVGSDELEFIQFSGAGQVIAGSGLSKSGNELYINMGAGIVELPSDEVGIDVYPTGSLFNTLDGSTSSTDTDAQLSVKLDGATLTSSASGLKVTDSVLSDINNNIQTVQNEVDAIETGSGLNTDGTYTATSTANYVGSAASLDAGIQALDTQVKANEDDLATEVTNRTNADTTIQNEVDAIETGSGLNTDGTYTAANSSNYISGATSLFNATVLLDTQAKSTSDALSQEVVDRTTAVTNLNDAINAGNYTYESSAEATSFTIDHNLGDAFVTVALWIKQSDNTFKNDIGQITLTSNNQLTVDLTAARNIRVVVTASKDI